MIIFIIRINFYKYGVIPNPHLSIYRYIRKSYIGGIVAVFKNIAKNAYY